MNKHQKFWNNFSETRQFTITGFIIARTAEVVNSSWEYYNHQVGGWLNPECDPIWEYDHAVFNTKERADETLKQMKETDPEFENSVILHVKHESNTELSIA